MGYMATNEWMFIYQGSWESLISRRGGYIDTVKYIAQFGTAFLSNAGEWGTPAYPHPKYFTNPNYHPTSAKFPPGHATPRQLFLDIKNERSECRLFPYISPCVDNITAEWDPITGNPVHLSWYEGHWENLYASIYALIDQFGLDVIDGFFMDQMAEGFMTQQQILDAIVIVKGFNKYCAPNIVFPYVSNAEKILKSPWMGMGDYLFSEGASFESVFGNLQADTRRLYQYMSDKMVPMALAVEAPKGTTRAQMSIDPQYYGRWIPGYCDKINYLRQNPGLVSIIQNCNWEYDHDPAFGGA